MRKRSLALIAVTIVAGGCHVLTQITHSAFLSKFSLEKSVRQIAYRGINNSPGSTARIGGDIAIGAGSISPRAAAASLSSSTAVMINKDGDDKFVESELLEALTSQIKKEIEDSKAIVTGSGNPTANAFYFEYKNDKINGRISIAGSRSRAGEYYLLSAKVDENW